MKFQAALVKEQGVTFAVVVVKRHVLSSPDRQQTQASLSPAFGGVPVVLMAQDSSGTPTYSGRPDLVRFLANIPMESLPWREWTVAA
jgi:hypothetical protein